MCMSVVPISFYVCACSVSRDKTVTMYLLSSEVSSAAEFIMAIILMIAGLWPWIRPRLSQVMVGTVSWLFFWIVRLATCLGAVAMLSRLAMRWMIELADPVKEIWTSATTFVASARPSPTLNPFITHALCAILPTVLVVSRHYSAEPAARGDNDRIVSPVNNPKQTKKVQFAGAIADEKGAYRRLYRELKTELHEVFGQLQRSVKEEIAHVWERCEQLERKLQEVDSMSLKATIPDYSSDEDEEIATQVQVSAVLSDVSPDTESTNVAHEESDLRGELHDVANKLEWLATNTKEFQRGVAKRMETHGARLDLAEEMIADEAEARQVLVAVAGATGGDDPELSKRILPDIPRVIHKGTSASQKTAQKSATSSRTPATRSKAPEVRDPAIEQLIARYSDPNVTLNLSALEQLKEKDVERILQTRRRRRPQPMRNPFLTEEEKAIARASLAQLGKLWRSYACKEKGRGFETQPWDSWDLGALTAEECNLPRSEVKYMLNTRRAAELAKRASDEGRPKYYCEECQNFKASPHRCVRTGWSQDTKRPGVKRHILVQQQGKGAIQVKPALLTDTDALQKEMQHLKVVQQENARRRLSAQEVAERPSNTVAVEPRVSDVATSSFQ